MEDSNRAACKRSGEIDSESKEKHGSNKSCSSSTTVSASFDDLPSEIILNILSRPPVKSSLRCRCVCKTWCEMIDNPSLIHMHMLNSAAAAAIVEKHHLVLISYPQKSYPKKNPYCPFPWHTNTITRLFSLKYEGGNISRTSEYPIAELVNAHEYHLSAINLGILIFTKMGQSFLLNPCRGEVLMLPPATVVDPPPGGRFSEQFGFGFDSTTNVYKVVRVVTRSIRRDPPDYVVEVYTLGTKSWRQISSVFPYPVHYEMPISAYGDVHWMISHDHIPDWMLAYRDIPKGSAESMIISFDIKREEFKLTPHPDFDCKIYMYFRLVDLRGSLAIIDFSSHAHMEIWVLKDYGRKKWAQEYKIRIDRCYYWFVGVWGEGLLFMYSPNSRFSYYSLKTGSLRYMSCNVDIIPESNRPDSPGKYTSQIYSFRGSLVSLRHYGNLMVKEVGAGNCFDLTAAGLDSLLCSMKI